ncbi:MAG TPA: UDP-2,4-diacetamido-2,4,6-trideoxy-beta-L-altropyranose hydrolase [Candidatus Limnocylindrales bacterium]|nr:UDP-2,4-diacetamido-2,4,6-trideoxy-beta-L-altropyranose hydrolase [Candidatus Limnocylindrales bacterium]
MTETLPHLVVRADAGSAIGTGHAMRLLALTQAWRDAGGAATLLTAGSPEWILERYEREGATAQRLDDLDEAADAAALVAATRAHEAAVAVVDGPRFDERYLDALEPIRDRTLAVDDMAALPRYPVAVVVNQNAHADRARYPQESMARFLLGLDYVLLRREFHEAPPRRNVAERGRRVLVTFGGADPTGMTMRALEALGVVARSRGDLEVVVVVGPANPAAEEIAGAVRSAPFTARLDRSVQDMTSRIAWADLALVSAGSTVWELARMGCPALVVETAPAEPHLAAGLGRLGLFDRLGPADGITTMGLAGAITARLDDTSWRAAMAALGPSLVDGRGAARVAGELRALLP